MIKKTDIKQILKKYDTGDITIGVLGGHSALDVCSGAKEYGFRTVAVCQKGREKTFKKYYKTRKDGRGCIDEVIVVDKFSDIVKPAVQKQLQKLNTIFIHNRYFWVYFDNFKDIEDKFKVPIFGLRQGVKLEERDQPLNQYHLLEKAGIRIPKIIRRGEKKMSKEKLSEAFDQHFNKDKGGPLLVKVNEAIRGYERAFFIATSEKSYYKKAEKMLAKGQIAQDTLDQSVIEEFVVGAQINLNFFYSPLKKELELMGTDARRQTDLDGFLRLNAKVQESLLSSGFSPKMIETGHYSVTMKESLVEKAFEIGEKFVKTMEKEVKPGMIGPFALQGAVAADHGKEEFVIFDVSMRIPGSPGTKFTPYSGYLYGETLSYGDRIAMELHDAINDGKLEDILT
jgi:5-formaminoimidazole-4-carboxamide-1-(beta)-D-ribofuranosyl 5'-monophosphate synthetase